MEAPIQQTPVDESQAEITSAQQATETIAQPQESITPPVERVQPTSQEPVVDNDPYGAARQIKALVKEFRSLKQSLNTRFTDQPTAIPQAPQLPQVPQVTREELIADPLAAIRKIVDLSNANVRQEILQQTQQREVEWKREQSRQEGLKLIKTNELIKRDPEGEERMKNILMEQDADGNTLDQYAVLNPKHAAQLALREYQARYGSSKNGVYAPSKAQMASTATSQTAGGGRMTTDAEIASIYAQIASNPDLMKDSQFMAKLSAIVAKSDTESKIRK